MGRIANLRGPPDDALVKRQVVTATSNTCKDENCLWMPEVQKAEISVFTGIELTKYLFKPPENTGCTSLTTATTATFNSLAKDREFFPLLSQFVFLLVTGSSSLVLLIFTSLYALILFVPQKVLINHYPSDFIPILNSITNLVILFLCSYTTTLQNV